MSGLHQINSNTKEILDTSKTFSILMSLIDYVKRSFFQYPFHFFSLSVAISVFLTEVCPNCLHVCVSFPCISRKNTPSFFSSTLLFSPTQISIANSNIALNSSHSTLQQLGKFIRVVIPPMSSRVHFLKLHRLGFFEDPHTEPDGMVIQSEAQNRNHNQFSSAPV